MPIIIIIKMTIIKNEQIQLGTWWWWWWCCHSKQSDQLQMKSTVLEDYISLVKRVHSRTFGRIKFEKNDFHPEIPNFKCIYLFKLFHINNGCRVFHILHTVEVMDGKVIWIRPGWRTVFAETRRWLSCCYSSSFWNPP